MGCYAVPLAATIIHSFMKKKEKFDTTKHKLLNQLFIGGSVFGVIDHLLNGEMFVFSIKDLLIGLAITGSILITWKIIEIWQRLIPSTFPI